jgi:UDP-N-acetylmuramate: L-alanyl-gamma-D-glutamyl-meso-diaminopimelate ligase
MGSLAGMLVEAGYEVRGSDAGAYPPMSTWLGSRGIDIMTGYVAEHLDWGPDLVVVGNICRRDNPEAVATLERQIPALSFPEVLRTFFLSGDVRPLVVTGTHGKTTTSAILAWILEHAGRKPSFMIGGITGNFGQNFKLSDGPLFVVEGDEYDTAYFDKVPKFWHHEPFRATINNVEFDHGDIYPDIGSIVVVFEKFAAMVHPDGTLWVNGDDPRAVEVATKSVALVRTFGLGTTNDLRAVGVFQHPDRVDFRLVLDGESLGDFKTPMPGMHNLRNFLGAMAIALDEGVTADECRAALPLFQTVKKRQELVGEAAGVLVYDDFAHHPSAVRETVRAIRARHPQAKLWAVFEAKSNTSRMAVFQDVYPPAFDGCDHVVLSAPWKRDEHLADAEKIDLPRVVVDLEHAGIDARLVPTVPEIVDILTQKLRDGDVVLGMSGSNFGGFHHLLLDALRNR